MNDQCAVAKLALLVYLSPVTGEPVSAKCNYRKTSQQNLTNQKEVVIPEANDDATTTNATYVGGFEKELMEDVPTDVFANQGGNPMHMLPLTINGSIIWLAMVVVFFSL